MYASVILPPVLTGLKKFLPKVISVCSWTESAVIFCANKTCSSSADANEAHFKFVHKNNLNATKNAETS